MAGKFLIQGHRGARGLRPENTLPSFEAALDAGVGSIETDVHLTADGVPVLIHDPVLPTDWRPWIRQLTAEQVCGTVADRLTAEQVCGTVADRNLDPARFPDQTPEPTPLASVFAGDAAHSYRIPTLARLFQFVAAYAGEMGRTVGKTDAQRANAARVIIDVEIKTVPFRAEAGESILVEEAVLEVIRSAGTVDRTWVRSFDHRCVRRLRREEPGLIGVVLIDGTAPIQPALLLHAADAQVYAPDYRFLDQDLVRRCHSAGFQVVPWTVNEPTDWERLMAWGVDGITTDYPDRLARWFIQPPASAK
jgi:glycerophosphoryl diester phosphodiesterase